MRGLCVSAALSLGFLLAVGGCDGKTAMPQGNPGDPPPLSAQQVQSQYEAVLAPLYQMVAVADPNSHVEPSLGQQYRAHLDEVRKKVMSSPSHKDGVTNVVKRLEDALRTAREAQNGPLVLLLCEIVRFFEPGNARLPRFEKWGEIVKNRPIPVIRGWYEPRDTDERTIYAFLEVYTPEDGQTHHVEVREGEEFLTLRFEKMIGDKAGIRLIYTVTGDVIEVYSPSWKRRNLQ